MPGIPGPKPRLFTGHLREFRIGRLEFFRRCAQTYGDVVQLRIVNRRILLFNRPDLIEQVLVTHAGKFVKHFGLRIYGPVLGNGLVTSEGEFWRRQRKLAAPAFQGARIARYAGEMLAQAAGMLRTWRDDEVRDVHADMMRLTLQIACKTLLGVHDSPDADVVGRALYDGMVVLGRRIRRAIPVPDWIPTRDNRRLKSSLSILNTIVNGIIRDHRQTQNANGDDLLARLLAERDEDGSRMSDRQLFDEALTLLLAGHETTALALSYSLYLLATHPAAQDQLHAELSAVLAGGLPSHADLPRLEFTRRVVTEAMRLYPPADVLGREAIEDCTIEGISIRRGTTIFMSQWVMHHDERYFPEPDRFDPGRWTPQFEKSLPRFAYFPFGGGPRYCIGQTFAMTEAILLLAAICQKFSLEPVPGFELVLWPNITLRPRDGVPLIIRRR